MSLTDNPAAVDAAAAAFRRRACELTMFDINQGPGEGNYDRIEQLCTEAAIQAAEAVQRAEKPTIEFLSFDEQDTMVMQEVNEDEGGK